MCPWIWRVGRSSTRSLYVGFITPGKWLYCTVGAFSFELSLQFVVCTVFVLFVLFVVVFWSVEKL